MQGSTTGAAAPFRFTTMRLEAHINSFGFLCRMLKQELGDLRHVGVQIHLGEEDQRGGIVGIDRPTARGAERGITGARIRLGFAPAGAAGERESKAFMHKPIDSFERLGE